MKRRVIAFANHKGGVGKTTSVAAIGAALAERGRRTLIVDLDAQQNLTTCYLDEDEQEVTIYEALTGQAPLPLIQVRERLFLCPAGVELAQADLILSTRIAREAILRGLLENMEEEFDYILLDCPPSLGLVTANALAAATDVYIPLTAEALPLRGLEMLDGVISEIAKGVNTGLRVSGVFVTRYHNRNLNNQVIEALRRKYGSKLFSTRIRENISVAEAPLTKEGIFSYAPNSNGARDYAALTDEIISREKDNDTAI